MKVIFCSNTFPINFPMANPYYQHWWKNSPISWLKIWINFNSLNFHNGDFFTHIKVYSKFFINIFWFLMDSIGFLIGPLYSFTPQNVRSLIFALRASDLLRGYLSLVTILYSPYLTKNEMQFILHN